MTNLQKVQEAMLSPYCVPESVRDEVKRAESVEECIALLAKHYPTNSMTGALAFLGVMKALRV